MKATKTTAANGNTTLKLTSSTGSWLALTLTKKHVRTTTSSNTMVTTADAALEIFMNCLHQGMTGSDAFDAVAKLAQAWR